MLPHNPLKYFKPATLSNGFREGELVFAKENPSKKLVIRRYVGMIYYCKIQGDNTPTEFVYFERDLIPLQ